MKPGAIVLSPTTPWSSLPPLGTDDDRTTVTTTAPTPSPTRDGAPPAPPRGTVAVLLVTATLTVMASAIIAPSLPGLDAEFADVPHADLLVRLMLTLPALFIAAAAPLLGALVDRVGRRTVLLASLALYGVAGGSGLVLGNLYAILAGRALLGVAVGGVFVASTALIADWFDGERRARMLGLQAAFMGIGGAVFLTVGGLLASVSPRGPFVVYALALVVLPFAARVITEPVRGTSAASTGSGRRARMPWALVALVLGVALLGMVAFYTVPTQLPFYLADLTGAGPTTSGLAIALLNVVGVVVSLNFGRVRARLPFTVVAVVMFVAIGAGLALVGTASSLAAVLVGLAVAGLGTGLLLPTLNAWISHGTPAALRGRALGILSTAIYLGQFLSPLASQPVARASSVGSAFVLAAALCAAVAVALAVLASSRRRREVLERAAA